MAQIELADSLYLEVRNIDYIPGDPGKYSGLPEDCYEATGPELDFKNEDCYLLFKETKTIHRYEQKPIKEIVDHYYECPKGMVDFYEDALIDECERILEDK